MVTIQEITDGARGSAVATLHGLLRAAGYLSAIEGDTFGLSTRNAVVRFQRENQMPQDGIVTEAMWMALRRAAAEAKSACTPCGVGADTCAVAHGHVLHFDGTPAPRLLVSLRDISTNRAVLLGQARTDENGRWELAYSRGAVRALGKALPDLQAQVTIPVVSMAPTSVALGDDVVAPVHLGDDPLVSNAAQYEVASDILYAAAGDAEIDIVLAPELATPRDEFTRTLTAVARVLAADVSIDLFAHEYDPADNDTVTDSLARFARQDVARVRRLVRALWLWHAHVPSETWTPPNSDLGPDSFYAVLAHDEGQDRPILYAGLRASYISVLVDAVERRIIPRPEAPSGGVTDPPNPLHVRADKLVNWAAAGKLTGDLEVSIKFAIPDDPDHAGRGDAVRLEFVRRWFAAQERSVSLDKFWSDLIGVAVLYGPTGVEFTTTFSSNEVRKLRAVLELHNTLNGLSSLVGFVADNALLTIPATGPVLLPVLSKTRDQWAETVGQWLGGGATLPSWVPDGLTQADKVAFMAEKLTRDLEDKYPTHALLVKCATKYQALAQLDVTDYATDLAKWRVPLQRTPTTAELKIAEIRRVFAVTHRAHEVEALVDSELTSAAKIAALSESEFVARVGASFARVGDDGTAAARAAHRTASHIAAQAASIRFAYGHNGAGNTLPSTRQGVLELQDAIDRDKAQALLPEGATCSCAECRSAIGPAAYLADLLHLLARSSAEGGSALGVLSKRRPDIEHLLLSCRNTSTTLPQIDLAIELLESAAVELKDQLPSATPVVLPPWNISKYVQETSGTDAERAAGPQVLNNAVYDALAQANYPLALPFELHYEEAAVYLQALGTDIAEVREAVIAPRLAAQEAAGANSTELDPLGNKLAAARLGCSDAVFANLITPAGDVQLVLARFGVTSTAEIMDSNGILVSKLIAGLGVNLQFIQEFARTRFSVANPIAASRKAIVTAKPSGDDCVLADLRLRLSAVGATGGDDVTPETSEWTNAHLLLADRLQRFTRLSQLLKLPPVELDQFVACAVPFASPIELVGVALSYPTAFNPAWLRQVGAAKACSSRLGVSIVRVASWANTVLDTYSYLPEYEGQSRIGSLWEAWIQRPGSIAGSGNSPADPLALNPNLNGLATNLPATGVSVIAAALGISIDEVSYCAAWRTDSNAQWTLAEISAALRDTSLAKALKLPIAEFDALRHMLADGLPSTTTPWKPRDLLDNLDTVKLLRQDGWSVREVRSQLARGSDPLADPVPLADTEELVDQLVAQLRKLHGQSISGVVNQPARYSFDLAYGLRQTFGRQLDGSTQREATVLLTGKNAAGETVQATPYSTPLASANAYPDSAEILNWAVSGLVYDPTAGTLSFPGQLSTVQRDAALAALASVWYGQPNKTPELAAKLEATKAAVKALYRKPLLALQSADLVEGVILGGLIFGDDRLRALSSTADQNELHDEWTDRLFGSKDGQQMRRWVMALLDSHGFMAGATKLCEEFVSSKAKVSQSVAERLLWGGLTAPVVAVDPPAEGTRYSVMWALLQQLVGDAGSQSEESRAMAVAALDKVLSVGRIISSWRFQEPEALWLVEYTAKKAGGVSWLDLDDLAGRYTFETFPAAGPIPANQTPTSRLRKWLELRRMANFLRDCGAATSDALDCLGSNWSKVPQLMQSYGWPSAGTGDLVAKLVASDPATTASSPSVLTQMANVLSLCRRVKVSPADLVAWSGLVALAPADLAASVQAAVQAHVGIDRWLEMAPALRDQLRVRQRDALVAFVDAQWRRVSPSTAPAAPNDMVKWFLLDVLASPCQPTSRIVAATCSVQMFVQQALMGEVPKFLPTDEFAEDWPAFSEFRVWQANRKMFLYPENWLDPQWRDDKTELFKEFEQQLHQGELTDDAVEASLAKYVDGLAELASLEAVSVCDQVDLGALPASANVDECPRVIQVLARTRTTPRAWFHRTFDQELGWTSWERVRLDIASNEAHVASIVGRLFLFSYRLEKEGATAADKSAGASGKDNKGQMTPGATPPERWSVRFSASERKQGGWCSPVTSEVFSIGDIGTTKLVFSIAVRADESGERAILSLGEALSSTYGVVLESWIAEKSLQWPAAAEFDAQSFRVYSEPIESFYWSTLGGSQTLGSQFVAVRVPLDSGDYLHALTGKDSTAVAPRIGCRVWPHSLFTTIADSDGCYFVNHSRFGSGGLGPDLGSTAEGSEYSLWLLSSTRGAELPGVLAQTGPGELLSQQRQIVQADSQNTAESAFKKHWSCDNRVDTKPLAPTIDFSPTMPTSVYNWELYFHVPLMISKTLAAHGDYSAAYRWLRTIFDPTRPRKEKDGTPSKGAVQQRFWQTEPLYQYALPDSIETLLKLLGVSAPAGADLKAAKASIEQQVAAYLDDPFNPFVVARYRLSAFQKYVVHSLVDIFTGWGDQEFRKDTLESNSLAVQFYVMAAAILGERPQRITHRLADVDPGSPPVDYSVLSASAGFDELSNSLETYLPKKDLHRQAGLRSKGSKAKFRGAARPQTLAQMHLYFCVPPNDELLSRWDTIEDRLFKLRHCLNIDGVKRVVALFAPPIDPGALLAAAAGGKLLGSGSNSSQQTPLQFYRFHPLLQKAIELCGDVRSLGGALLAALEKRDAEALAAMRSRHEVAMARLVEQVCEDEVAEASKQLDVLKASAEIVQGRLDYYQSREFMNGAELIHLGLTGMSALVTNISSGAQAIASVAAAMPQNTVEVQPFGPSFGIQMGGEQLARVLTTGAGSLQSIAASMNAAATISATLGSYQRRADEWSHQAGQAQKELAQIAVQVEAANLRLATATRRLENQRQQAENSSEVADFLAQKFTNADLYTWMVGRLSSLYSQTYELALAMARRAEQAYNSEIGGQPAQMIASDSWSTLHRGLLAGETLQLDLRRMESRYFEERKREFELTKTISLAVVAPAALLELRSTGGCSFSLSELLFDLDHPGHYMRRIRSVSVTLPCVTGPHTGARCKLTLTGSAIRRVATVGSDYVQSANDSRFLTAQGPLGAIVTSSGQNDMGTFEGRDEARLLPFEGQGAVSSWRLELPGAVRTAAGSLTPTDLAVIGFDPNSLTDVIIHLRYTAREGGQQLQGAAFAAVGAAIAAASPIPRFQLLSLKTDFSAQWTQLKEQVIASGQTTTTLTVSVALDRLRYPERVLGATPTPDLTKAFAVGSGVVSALTVSGTKVDNSPGYILAVQVSLSASNAPALITGLSALDDVVLVLRY